MEKKTIYDLANELGIAPSTISKALNNKKGVNPKTRAKIIQYAKEFGYVANPTAATLKSKKNYSIGVLYSEEAHVGLEHPFFSPVLQSAKEYLEEQGYDLIFINAKSKDFKSYELFCSLRNIDGVFVVSARREDVLLDSLLKDEHIKIVATDYINDDVPTVLSDNKQGIADLIQYFKENNIDNVGMVIPELGIRSFKERYDSFIEECKKNDIKIDKDFIILGGDYHFDSTVELVSKIVKEKGCVPKAFFALSDHYAIATMKALANCGYHIPNDCRVIGFDDIELGRYITPKLSTIKQNAKEIGKEAAKLLLSQLNGENPEEKIIRVPVTLKIRES